MNHAVAALSKTPSRPALYGGFCGVAWAAEYLSRAGANNVDPSAEESDDDPNAEIDDALIEMLQVSPWEAEYDLIGGLVGYGVYFSERLHRESARRGMQLIVERLDETKAESEGGLSWHTSPDLLPPWQRETNPDGYFNVGMAHGVPGVLVILAIAVANGIVTNTSRPLLDGLVYWLRAIRQDADSAGSYFPAWWMPECAPELSRRAWCYGDPGVGAAWLWAGMLTGEKSWQNDALEVLRFCAKLPHQAAGVGEAGLCHGSLGLGQLYNRVYQATAITDFREAAVGWLRHGFGYHGEKGYGGYQSYWPRGLGPDEDPWRDDFSFLRGSIGIGLVYLAGISEIAPDWDRVLLLTIPSGGAPSQTSGPAPPPPTLGSG